MSALDIVDELAEKIAIGYVVFLVMLMLACVSAMMVLMWQWATTELGVIAGTMVWLIAVTIAFSVSWAGYGQQARRDLGV